MKSPYHPKKHHKRSKFDPYMNEITKYVITGVTVKEIAELIEYHFDDVVDVNALYCFMRSRGIRSYNGTNNMSAPRCKFCDNCLIVTTLNNTQEMICLPSKHVIRNSCVTSPIWCHRRKKAERVS